MRSSCVDHALIMRQHAVRSPLASNQSSVCGRGGPLGVLFASGLPGLLQETLVFDNQAPRSVGGARKSARVIN
jgi:hypothetical protein